MSQLVNIFTRLQAAALHVVIVSPQCLPESLQARKESQRHVYKNKCIERIISDTIQLNGLKIKVVMEDLVKKIGKRILKYRNLNMKHW